MKRLIWYILLVILPVVCWSPLSNAQEVLDRIAAIVDDDVILESEVTQGAYFLAMQMRVDPTADPDKFKELQKMTLDNLIVQQILLTKAEEDTIEPDQARVEAYLDQQMQSIIQQMGSEEKAEEYFGLPMRKIRRNYDEEIRKNLTVQTVRDMKFVDTKVSRREVEQFYATNRDSLPELKESVNISHILIEVKPGEEARRAALDRITEIKNRLEAGEDFAELAQDFSDDPGSAPRGGDLGFMQRGEFVREFEEVAFTLEPGQRSTIVETQFGFHIIEHLERRGEKIRVRHILVSLETTREDEEVAAERIKEIDGRLRDENVDFTGLATEVSDDKSTVEEGGSLGWFEIDQLRETAKEFVPALRGLEPGETSEPFRSKYGFHILKLNDRREARPLSLNEDWETLEQIALNDKKQREFEKWVDGLRQEIYIEIKER
jgi:peptidyl-prolyl cis-trans isomerase SurA